MGCPFKYLAPSLIIFLIWGMLKTVFNLFYSQKKVCKNIVNLYGNKEHKDSHKAI